MRRAVKYPIVVFFIGILASIIVPVLFDEINAYNFGHLGGGITFYAFIIALIIGFICDRRHKKKSQENK